MFKKIVIACALLLHVSLFAHAADWHTQEVAPGLSIEFPAQPIVSKKQGMTGYSFQGQKGDKLYTMAVVVMPVPKGMINSQKDIEESYEGSVESLQKRGKIVKNAPIDLHGIQGREIEVSLAPEQKISAITVLSGNHFLNVQFYAQAENSEMTEVKEHFFKSISLPQNGSQAAAADSSYEEASSSITDDPRAFGQLIAKFLIPVAVIVFVISRIRRKKSKV